MTKIRNAVPETVCENCGRCEVTGAYCTWCFAWPMTGIRDPKPADLYAVRHALIALHGWRSKILCPEIVNGRQRLHANAIKAGFGWWGWHAPGGYV